MDRLWTLTQDWLDGEASDAELRQLEERLAGDRQALAWFVDTCRVDELLRHSLPGERIGTKLDAQLAAAREKPAALAAAQTSRRSAGLPVAGALFRRLLEYPKPLSLSVAAVFIVVLVGTLWWVSAPVYRDWTSQRVALPQGVARLTETRQAVWANGASPKRRGQRLFTGQRLELQSGAVEIVYDSGATVVVVGPAELTLDAPPSLDRRGTPGGGKLQRGRMLVYAPPTARGFTVWTPGAEFVDLGTRFGVEVDPQANTSVHVLEGKVEARPRDGQGFGPRVLGQGQSARIAAADDGGLKFTTSNTALASSLSYASMFPSLRPRMVALQHATADVSQKVGANRPVAESIDGIVNDDNGWAFGGGPQFDDHVGVWETASDLHGPCALTFSIYQRGSVDSLTLRRVRVSATGDPRDQFADGRANDGDVDANWTALAPTAARTSNGGEAKINDDRSISFANDDRIADGRTNSIYVIEADCPLEKVTGIRLEVFAEPTVGYYRAATGPHPGGNAHVTEIVLLHAATEKAFASD